MDIRLVVLVLLSLSLFDFARSQVPVYDCRRLDDCRNGGTCTYEDSTCVCAAGFEGYNCQAASDTTCTAKTCDNNGICYVDKDTAVEMCACAYGYYGDTCDRESVSVTCNGPSVNFTFAFPPEFEGIIQLTGTTTPKVCPFNSTILANGMKAYSLIIDTTQDSIGTVCGQDRITVSTDEATTDSNYTGRIVVRYSNLIVTTADELYTLTCSHMGGNVEISKEITNIDFSTESNLTQVEKVKPYSPVDFEIVDVAGSPLPAVIFVGDSYKICFFLTDTSVYSSVFITSCTTNNTVDPPDTKTYEIYSQGCPTKKGMVTTSRQEAANKTIGNTTYPSVCLPIKAFKFVDSDKLALSCQVKLCKADNTGCAIPTAAECTTIMAASGTNTATTVAPDTNATTAAPDTNATTAAPDTNATTSAPDTNATTAAPDTNATTAAPDTNATTAAPANNTDNTTTAAALADDTTATGDGGGRRKRAAGDAENTEEKTVSTVLTVHGERGYTSDQSQGQVESIVEECLSQTEIMAVVTVLASVVLILFIACFVLSCMLMRRKSKLNVFEPHSTLPNPERFHIPRAHVNQAYREI